MHQMIMLCKKDLTNGLRGIPFAAGPAAWPPGARPSERGGDAQAQSDATGDQARRNNRRSRNGQCGDRPYSFVVHGLWPQYEQGFPEFCQQPPPRLDRDVVASMLDLMPSPRLIFREWDRHGTCSGLAARAYFETVRKARALVKIPPDYLGLTEGKTVSPAEVEDAFIAANPGLPHDAIAVGCDAMRLNAVRICLSKDLQFHSCAEVDQRSCKREQVVMPRLRVHGG